MSWNESSKNVWQIYQNLIKFLQQRKVRKMDAVTNKLPFWCFISFVTPHWTRSILIEASIYTEMKIIWSWIEFFRNKMQILTGMGYRTSLHYYHVMQRIQEYVSNFNPIQPADYWYANKQRPEGIQNVVQRLGFNSPIDDDIFAFARSFARNFFS